MADVIANGSISCIQKLHLQLRNLLFLKVKMCCFWHTGEIGLRTIKKTQRPKTLRRPFL